MPTPLEQSLAAKFNAASAAFADSWKVGTFDWLQGNAIGAMVTITLAEQQLDATWLRVKQGTAPVSEFDAALEQWRQAHVGALKEFTSRSGQ